MRQHSDSETSAKAEQKTLDEMEEQKLNQYGIKVKKIAPTQPPVDASPQRANFSSNGTANVSLSRLPHLGSSGMPPLQRQKSNGADTSLTNETKINEPDQPTVIHFLFMINNWLPHADIWEEFFSAASPGSMHSYVHCQDYKHCYDTGLFKVLPNLRPIPTQPTWYCHDLVTAMTQLLKASLSMNSVPPNAREKFVFLSESTLPLKNFSQVHAALSENDDSDFCMFPMDQWATTEIQGRNVFLPKHHQWVVLNREHAERMVDNWQPVQGNGFWKVPLREKNWPKGTSFSPSNFKRGPSANWCTDEWAFFATIFGAFEPENTIDGASFIEGFSGGPLQTWGPPALSMQGTCRTFSYWDQKGETFIALAKTLSVDPFTLSCYPRCYDRPATFRSLSDNAIKKLHESPFLFARKFEPYMALPNFQGIVFGTKKAPLPPSGPMATLNFAVPEPHEEKKPQRDAAEPAFPFNASQYQFVVVADDV